MHFLKIETNLGILAVLLCLAWDSSGHPVEKRSRKARETEGSGPRVFLTVSSLASRDEAERRLELNWYGSPIGLNEHDGARVRLYDHDPADDVAGPLVSVRPTHHPEGYYRSSVQFPRPLFAPDNLTDACLDFWIAYVLDERVLSLNCLRARPHWMFEMRAGLGRVSLPDLFIPGTHNAGSYARFDQQEDSIFRRYLMTQEESIWNQLAYGIRYLDVRVAYHASASSADPFWITHGHFRTEVPLGQVLRQVRGFLNATSEIVILDFHRFVTGFSGRRAPHRHTQLIQRLEQELGEFMIPVSLSSWVTLNELWQLDKRLYVGYGSNKDRRQSSLLFPAIKHLWGDVDRVDRLHEHLNGTVCDRRNQRLTSAMAQLTPTTSGAIFDTYGGLRKMAHDVNRHATRWFREDWPYCTNIVATDYFLGNNMIETAIEVNKDKFFVAV